MRRLIAFPIILALLVCAPACTTDNSGETEIENPSGDNTGNSGNSGDSGNTGNNSGSESGDNGNTDSGDSDNDNTGNETGGRTKTLVAYFSAQGHTQGVAERIVALIGGDIYRITAKDAYASNPYNDSERIQDEAYNDKRPAVADPPAAETIAKYDTLFVGSPCWWHQPAMVVCTFLETYDLTGKVVIPFFTYGATTYLNESMQKIYKVTPNSEHIPATLPEDLNPDDITTAGPADDAGIDMPGNANGTESWLRRIGVLK